MEGKLVFAAAQIPFETGGSHFCPLVPVCYIDGEQVNAELDFPNTGLCWFMLRDVRFQGLTPGQLVVGPVEPTRDWQTSAPDKHWYQLKVETAQLAGAPDTVLEVIDAGPDDPRGPRALIGAQRKIHLDHRPTDLVMVRFGQRYYGPFRARARRDDGSTGSGWSVTFERTSQNKIWQADEIAIAGAGGLVKTSEIQVSLEDAPPSKATLIQPIRYTFIPWDHFEKLRQAGAVEIELLTDAEILGRAAREHRKPKAKRQQLQQLLRELEDSLQDVPEAFAKTALATARGLTEQLVTSERLGDSLVAALLSSGTLDEQIEGEKKKRFEEYVEARAAEAQSRIADRVREAEQQHEVLSVQVNELKAVLKREKDETLAEVDAEIRSRRAKADAQIEDERRQLDEQHKALRREQETLANVVSQAADRFDKGRSELLSDLLAILPALQATGILQSPTSTKAQATPTTEEKLPTMPTLPAAFTKRRFQLERRLDEGVFFERFARHVQDSGFRYRDAHLKAFHISVKCSDLTILTGLSGIGKSSLVRLYAEALAGEDEAARALNRKIFLVVRTCWIGGV
jgi:hypothetical protein